MVSCKSDINASLYEVRISDDEKNWKWFGAHNTSSVKVDDIPRGIRIYVQMRLKNHLGHSPWSASTVGMIPQPDAIMSLHE